MNHPLLLNRRQQLATLLLFLPCPGCDSHEKSKPTQDKSNYDLDLPQSSSETPVYQDTDIRLEVMKPETCEVQGILAPARGNVRLAYPIKLEALSSREVPVGPMLFSLIAEGHTYRPTLATCKEVFHAGKLTRQEVRMAHVVFDVAHSERPTHLIFEPYLVGRKAVVAKVRIPE